MNAPELLVDLESKGVRVRLVGDRIRVEGPAEVVGPRVRDQVQAQKTEIVEELLRRASATHSHPPIPPATPATLQRFPLQSGELITTAEARFLGNGVQPAPDDLRAAAWLEDYLARWGEVLEGLYAGRVSLVAGTSGGRASWPRGLPS